MDVAVYFGFRPIVHQHKTAGNAEKGRKLFKAGHVLNLKEWLGQISACVIRQTSITLPPYSVSLTFNALREVQQASCQCIAGLSESCKHISAVVFAINEEDCSTKTSRPCEWNKPSAHKISQLKYSKGKRFCEMFPVPSFSNLNKKLKATIPEAIQLEKVLQIPSMLQLMLEAEQKITDFQRWYQNQGNKDLYQAQRFYWLVLIVSAVLCFRNLHEAPEKALNESWKAIFQLQAQSIILEELNQETFNIYGGCCIDSFNKYIMGDVLDICVKTFKSKEKWHEERRYRITASRCYNLFTYCGIDWDMKIKKYFWPKSFENKYTKHGVKWESEARKKYAQSTGNEVIETGLIVCKTDRWLAVSPDGVIFNNNIPQKILEIKCPYEGRNVPANEILAHCSYLKIDDNGIICLKEKHTYYGQVQLTMAVLNLPSCDLVIFCSYDMSHIKINVPFDVGFTKNLLSSLKSIYFAKMLHYICMNEEQ